VAVSPARVAAFNILLRVERESAYAVELLHGPLLDELSLIDRNLATEIVMGVLRWRSSLDHVIARFSFTSMRKLDFEVLTALRMGVYQKQFLTKVPAHAAVHETVELVKQAKKVSAAGLVNAIMRKVGRAGSQLPTSVSRDSSYLSVSYAHPRWLVERWVAFFSHDIAQKICDYDQRIPATVLRLNSPEDEALLAEQNIQLAPGALMAWARVVTSGDTSAMQVFSDGQVL
jgi:16S rRNA (cytosine967-C5)-methyltransferase